MRNLLCLLFVINLSFASCEEVGIDVPVIKDSNGGEGKGGDKECRSPRSLEEGNYHGLWSSIATNGSVYVDLPITATIEKNSEGEYTGFLYISDNFTSCCNPDSERGDGPITISIDDEGEITFSWIDEIPFCPGEFIGTGTYIKTNEITLITNGSDCEGQHMGSIRLFE